MLARYIAVWKLRGANKLTTEQPSVTLASLEKPQVAATLTADPEPYFVHIDKEDALVAQLLNGIIGQKNEGSPEERLAAEIKAVRVRRSEKAGNGIFLVFEGERDIPSRKFRTRRDTDEFAVCLDDINKSEIKTVFQPFVNAALARLGLSLPPNADRQIERIGEVVYFIDPESEKPIYAFTVDISARASISSLVTAEAIAEARDRIASLVSDKTMVRPASLISASFDQRADALKGFIAAWSALEVFINASFKAHYKERLFKAMDNGAPVAAKPVFERFKEIMRDEYQLADRFLAIAAMLDAEAAAGDANEFRRLKEIRNRFFHGSATPTSLPTEPVQNLLLKYMKLHLDSQNAPAFKNQGE